MRNNSFGPTFEFAKKFRPDLRDVLDLFRFDEFEQIDVISYDENFRIFDISFETLRHISENNVVLVSQINCDFIDNDLERLTCKIIITNDNLNKYPLVI